MDNMKLNLLNQIKSFSMPDFPDLHILSKAWFYDLFLKSYKIDDTYSLLYGDIDGLKMLNDEIGFEKADLAIEELLKTTLSLLPNNTISFRVGGDEFCFIIPNFSIEQTRELTKDIHTNLLSNPNVKGLDITFGSCDSKQFDSITDMYHFAENKVTLKKHAHLHLDEDAQDIVDFNEKLDKFIDFTIKSYIKNFRFSSRRYFTREDLETLSSPILNSITNLLNKEHSNINSEDINEESITKNPVKIKSETLKDLYKLIISQNIDFETLQKITSSELIQINHCLSTDSITNAYNSVYRDHYLLKNIDVPVQILLAESLGIKISNSVLTHSGTDQKINYTFNTLYTALKSLVPENSDTKIIPIHNGGGTFEFILKNNADVITYNHLKQLLHEMSLDDNNFYILGILGNCSDVSEYSEVRSKLNKICDFKKDRIKKRKEYLISPTSSKLLDISLSSLVNYFKTQSENLGIYNEQEKINFTKKVIHSLVDNFNDLNLDNLENSEIKKNTSNTQIDER